MDIYETLHKDHQTISGLFKAIEDSSSTDINARDNVFSQLKDELDIHSRAEDEVFYSELAKHSDSLFSTLQAREEHHIVDMLLKELDAMPKESDQWFAKLCVLKENVEHHVDQEETELFGHAKSYLSADQAQSLGSRFDERKGMIH